MLLLLNDRVRERQQVVAIGAEIAARWIKKHGELSMAVLAACGLTGCAFDYFPVTLTLGDLCCTTHARHR